MHEKYRQTKQIRQKLVCTEQHIIYYFKCLYDVTYCKLQYISPISSNRPIPVIVIITYTTYITIKIRKRNNNIFKAILGRLWARFRILYTIFIFFPVHVTWHTHVTNTQNTYIIVFLDFSTNQCWSTERGNTNYTSIL